MGITAVVALTLTLPVCAYYVRRQIKRERESTAILNEALSSGLIEPASLHPVIDPAQCIGCGTCVDACPEGRILGLIDGKAELVSPSHCIGHGACKTACPSDAIELVFGTERRGVDIPHVAPDFETNVPGIFIAGELGGMGLIRNAIEQGRQAVDSVARHCTERSESLLDVLIVGAGPAGFSASLGAMEKGLRFVTVEQETLGGTVAHFPRGKVVMTAPAQLPIHGAVHFRETTKEELMSFWEGVEAKTGLQIQYRERVDEVTKIPGGFRVTTSRGSYETRTVLLTIGRRGTPRKLGVPGEELPKVAYRLIDPEQFRNKSVLVVGGGDSALEAATSLAEEAGTRVTLSYRSGAFNRAKPKNRDRVQQAETAGKLDVLMKSNVRSIAADHVIIEQEGVESRLVNDAVIVSAGGILPTGFLEKVGVAVETKHGTA